MDSEPIRTVAEIQADIEATQERAKFLAVEEERKKKEAEEHYKERCALVGGWGRGSKLETLKDELEAAKFRDGLIGKPTVMVRATSGAPEEWTLVKVTPKQIHLTKPSKWGGALKAIYTRAGRSRYDGQIISMDVVEAFVKVQE
jgi:hypothetical protein